MNNSHSKVRIFSLLLILGLLHFDVAAEDKFKTTYDISAIGVFTRAKELMDCDAKGGDWRPDVPGEWGTYYCYGPYSVILSDENISSRAVIGKNTNYTNKKCGPAVLYSDTGWTLEDIPIPSELHEYFTRAEGLWSPGKKIWNRLMRVDSRTDGVDPGTECTVTSSLWWLATKTVERVKEVCRKEVGNPIRPHLGEKAQAIDFSGDLGFGFSLKYSSATRPVLQGGTGAWALPADAEMRTFGQVGSQFKVVHGHELGTELRFDRVGQEWIKAQKTDATLKDVADASVLLLPEQGVIYKFSGSELRQKVNIDGSGLYFEYDSVADMDGNFMPRKLLSAADIRSGRSVSFKYKWIFSVGTSRVDSVLDEMVSNEGVIKFGNVAGVLSGLTYSNGDRIVFSYDNPAAPWLLTGVVREDGKSFGSFQYDDQLRARSTAASGEVNKYSAEYADELSRGPGYSSVKVTTPNGGVTTTILKTSIIQGELIRQPYGTDQAGGSGCAAASSSITYNDAGDRVSAVDFAGRRTCSSFDPSRSLETTRLEGLLDADSCPPDLGSYTIPAGLPAEKSQRKTSTQWHPVWHLKTREAEPKRITTWVYNGQPDPLNNNTVASCAPADALLPDGSKIAVLCKRYEQATSDENGNLGFAASVVSTRSWSSSYNKFGQLLTEIDPRGKTTSYEYWPDTVFTPGDTNLAGEARGHTLGDLKAIVRPGNQATRHTHYNKRGQVLRTELPNGSVEEREYHPRGWLAKVKKKESATAAVSQDTVYEYYPTGLLKKVTQPDGSWQLSEYDDAHRLTDLTDNLGNKVHYTLDNAGNRTDEVYSDAQQVVTKTIRRKFDALGRMSMEQVGAQALPGPVADGPAFYRSPFGGTRLWKAGRENACIVIDGDPTCTVVEGSFDPATGAINCKATCQSGWGATWPAEGPRCTDYGDRSVYKPATQSCESAAP